MTHFVYILSKMRDIDYTSVEGSLFETFVIYKLQMIDFVYNSLFDTSCMRTQFELGFEYTNFLFYVKLVFFALLPIIILLLVLIFYSLC
jgi:hypothetical protein